MYAYIKYPATGLVRRIPAESLEVFLSDDNDEVIVAHESEWTEESDNAADGEVVVETVENPVEPEPVVEAEELPIDEVKEEIIVAQDAEMAAEEVKESE